MVQHGEAGNEDWLKVAKGVLNGFVLVLISLSWWWAGATESSDRRVCEDTVANVLWVLE